MPQLSGYSDYSLLNSGDEVMVFRAVAEATGKNVVVKTHVSLHATPELKRRLEYEISILRMLHSPFCPLPVEWLEKDKHAAIVLGDIHGESLDRIVGAQPISLLQVIYIIRGIAQALADIHDAGIVHGAISPGNVVVNQDTAAIQVIDYFLARRVNGSSIGHRPLELRAADLPYLSPEQAIAASTGSDWAAEPRSDLYSLGCVFYELVTGAVPFQDTDPAALLHAHIARLPRLPSRGNEQLPNAIERIILKLLAKNPEDRYQSAARLERDLRLCENRIRHSEALPTDFEPDSFSGFRRLTLPHKLYGRSQYMDQLLKARLNAMNSTGMALVRGVSGIGKTSLIHGFRSHPALAGVSFLEGKFDQAAVRVPYSGFTNAFTTFFDDLLSLPPADRTRWRDRILAECGRDFGELVALIPMLVDLLGSPEPNPSLDPKVAANRLRNQFRQLLRLMATPEQSLVMFLDDLQWADRDSLAVLRDIAEDPTLSHLFLVGSFRSEELTGSPALDTWLSSLMERKSGICDLELKPLTTSQVEAFLTDADIKSDIDRHEFAARLGFRCEGNPLLIHRSLTNLHNLGMLTPVSGGEGWNCPSRAIDEDLAERNLASIIGDELQMLPALTINLLSRAACLGNIIDIDLLTVAVSDSVEGVRRTLYPAVRHGLLVRAGFVQNDGPVSNDSVLTDLVFIHDRVQQVAYEYTSATERKAVQLNMGRALATSLEDEPSKCPGNWLFAAVAQINRGESLVHDNEERLRYARLNLTAAMKSRQATAFAEMLHYLNNAERFFPQALKDEFSGEYALITYYRAQAEQLNGNSDGSRKLAAAALRYAGDPLLRSDIYDLLIINHTLCGAYRDALNVGRRALVELGIELPEADISGATRSEMIRVLSSLTGRTENPEKSPTQADRRTTAKLRILVNLLPPTDFAHPELNLWLPVRGVRLSEECGYAPESSKMLMNFANILLMEGDYERSYQLATRAVSMADAYKDDAIRARVLYTFVCYIRHWTQPLVESPGIGENAYKACLAAGEVQYAGYVLAFHKVMNELFIPRTLRQHASDLAQYAGVASRTRNTIAAHVVQAANLPVQALLGKTSHGSRLDDDGGDGGRLVQEAKSADNRKAVCLFHVLTGWYWLIHGEPGRALQNADSAASDLTFVSTTLVSLMQPLLRSLALTAGCRGTWSDIPATDRGFVESTLDRLAKLVDQCPANFSPLLHLLRGEISRLKEQHDTTMIEYEAAVESGAAIGFPPTDALAADFAWRYWEERARPEMAMGYAREARQRYGRWGATSRTKQIDAQVEESRLKALEETAGDKAPFSSLGLRLDLKAMIQAATAIAGETESDGVLKRLLEGLIARSGAERIALVLEEEGESRIKVMVHVTDDSPRFTLCDEQITDESPLSNSIVDEVKLCGKPLVLTNALEDEVHGQDRHIRRASVRSILCVPLIEQKKLVGTVYLENSLTPNAFRTEQVELVRFLSSIAAISMARSRLLESLKEMVFTLEDKVVERTKQLERSKEKAERATAAKTVFLRNMSHELRTPLNAIIGFSDTLNRLHSGSFNKQQQEYLEPRQGEYIKDIYDSGALLLELINELLDLAKIEAGQIGISTEKISPHDLVNASIHLVEQRAKDKGIKIHRDLDPACEVMVADLRRMKQVLINLLSNAIKFSPEGGTVVTCLIIKPDCFEFQIEDSGPGIPEPDRERIFEPFVRLQQPGQPSVPGTGLGLSLSRELVELHGGNLSVSAGRLGGALFAIRLPRGIDT